MPKYLIEANYVGAGIGGLLKEGGSSRRAAIQQLVESLGGTLEAFYYAFGDVDVYTIIELPDSAHAVAAALTVAAGGMVTLKTTVLLEPEEIDSASKLSPTYRPVGT